MRLLIDGYNLLFRLRKQSKSLQSARQELIADISILLASRTFESTMIFDSDDAIAEIFPNRTEHPPIEVIYSPLGKTADCYILELVEIAKHPKQITVVSSDRGLTSQAKCLGANIMTVEDFLTMIHKRKPREIKEETPHLSRREIDRLEEIFEKRLREIPSSDDKTFS